jgi:hypothetical protein
MGNSNSVAEGIRELGVGDTQVAQLLERTVRMDLRVHVRADATDVAHFVKDGTQLRREEQQGQT